MQYFHVQKEFDNLAIQFANHPHVRLVLRCEETLTHNIFAAADLFVIPSIFEPCGLTQVSLDLSKSVTVETQLVSTFINVSS